MYLKDLAQIIYTEDTASENTKITVITYGEIRKTLWTGTAKQLQDWDNIKGWIVVEVLIDQDDKMSEFPGMEKPDYNRGKIITVI